MQKLLSLLNPANLFPVDAVERPAQPGKVNRRLVVQERVVSKTIVRSKAKTNFSLSVQTVFVISASLAVINATLFIGYLFSVNAQANTGYQIKKLENKIAEETIENKKLLVQASEANSIASVQQSLAAGAFVPITARDTVYVQINQLSQK